MTSAVAPGDGHDGKNIIKLSRQEFNDVRRLVFQVTDVTRLLVVVSVFGKGNEVYFDEDGGHEDGGHEDGAYEGGGWMRKCEGGLQRRGGC